MIYIYIGAKLLAQVMNGYPMSFKEFSAKKYKEFAFARASAKHMIDIKPYEAPADDVPTKQPKKIPVKAAPVPHA